MFVNVVGHERLQKCIKFSKVLAYRLGLLRHQRKRNSRTQGINNIFKFTYFNPIYLFDKFSIVFK